MSGSSEIIPLACAAVLFDCDGVLVDSREAGERAWTEWAERHGLSAAAVLDGIHGRRAAETVGMFLPPEETAQSVAEVEELELATAGDILGIPGASELVRTIPEDRVALVTSASTRLASRRLQVAGVPIPAVIVDGSDVEHGKPAPDCYLLAAERLGVSIADCVIFEDSPTGIRAGLIAGAKAVVGVGESASSTAATLVVRSLEGIRWDGGLAIPTTALL